MSASDNQNFSFQTIAANGMDLHCASCGDVDKPLFVFLHGFPEFWRGWSAVMPHFAGSHHCVAPDQRGYNLSSKPEGRDAYKVRHLVADLHALAQALSPDRPFVLAGHDWGASVAYAYAMHFPDRLRGLIIANGVHPAPFQKALIEDPGQIAASQYIHLLRSERAEEVLSRNKYEKLLSMLDRFSTAPFLTPELKAAYLAAWSHPGALTGMLNWYRASPLHVPLADEVPDVTKALEMKPETLQVNVPHLLVHGLRDQALLTVSFQGLEAFAADLEVSEVKEAGHWILHERPEQAAGAIADWLARKGI